MLVLIQAAALLPSSQLMPCGIQYWPTQVTHLRVATREIWRTGKERKASQGWGCRGGTESRGVIPRYYSRQSGALILALEDTDVLKLLRAPGRLTKGWEQGRARGKVPWPKGGGFIFLFSGKCWVGKPGLCNGALALGGCSWTTQGVAAPPSVFPRRDKP